MSEAGGAAARPRYELVSLIATGGMGQVWRSHDTLLDRDVAVKLLKPEYAGDATFRSRFEAEARLAAGLQHPHVASVLDYGVHDDPDGGEPRPMLVMELVDGQPLSALIGDGRLSAEEAGDLVAQAGEGLAAAHRKGIVHRDVKPGNLLVTPQGLVKVTDFGIARAADAASLTLTGHLVGTPHYLSPEQAEGHRATAASDVYALGVVLFECLSGTKPFESDSPVVTAMRHVRDPLPPLPDSVPQRLREVVERACAKDPSQRFADGAAMAAALRGEVPVWPAAGATGAAGDEPATTVLPTSDGPGATRTMPLTGPVPTATPAPPAPPATDPADAERRRRAGLWAAGAVAAVLLLVPLGWAARSLLDGSGSPSVGASTGTSTGTAAPTTRSVAAQTVRVPDDLVGTPEPDARRRLEDLGLEVRVERRANPGGEQAGTVAEVDPTGEVEPGTPVTLAVWDASAQAPAPKPGKVDKPGKGGKGKGKKGKG